MIKAVENLKKMVEDNSEYQAVISKYTDKDGKLSYDLINRDMIKFAKDSRVVQTMVDERKTEDEIGLYVIGTRFRDITGNHDLTDEQVKKMVDMLDSVGAKGVLKEFSEEIRKMLAANKRK